MQHIIGILQYRSDALTREEAIMASGEIWYNTYRGSTTNDIAHTPQTYTPDCTRHRSPPPPTLLRPTRSTKLIMSLPLLRGPTVDTNPDFTASRPPTPVPTKILAELQHEAPDQAL